MKGHRFNRFSTFLLIVAALFSSCSKLKEKRYVKQLKANLPLYDSITSALIAKFSNRSEGNRIIIYPVGEATLADLNYRAFDTSIRKFCNQNDISYVEIECASNDSLIKNCNVTYFLSDNNYQYVFDSRGRFDGEIFENTRVLVVPITNKWVFQYEKPNF